MLYVLCRLRQKRRLKRLTANSDGGAKLGIAVHLLPEDDSASNDDDNALRSVHDRRSHGTHLSQKLLSDEMVKGLGGGGVLIT